MTNLSPQQFMHYSDHVFNPGDEVRPAAETGHKSEYTDNEHYHPDKVYLMDKEHASWDTGAHHYGTHAYEVEPVGRVERDPEAVHLESFYRQHGLGDEDLEVERARAQFAAPRAKVVRHVGSDDSFRSH